MSKASTPPNFNRFPLLLLAVSFAVGILAASLVNVGFYWPLAGCAILAAAALLFRDRDFAVFLILAGFAAAGTATAAIERECVPPNRLRVLYDTGTIHSGDPVEVEGVLTGRPEPSVDGDFLNLRAERLAFHGSDQVVSGTVRLFLPADHPDNAENDLRSDDSDLKYGSRIRVVCRLAREDEFLNPGVMPKRELLDRLGIDATGSIKSRMLVEKTADERVFLPLAWVYDRRAQLIADFRGGLGHSAAGIMIASLLGDKYFLDKDTADLFRDGGTFHILVISGLHITFIGGLLLLLMKRLTRNRYMQFIVTGTVLWAFTLAVGADVPVVRAAIMFTIVLFSYVIYRQGNLLNSLGVCGLALLVWRPSDLFNPSFQLTFVSVGAIVAMAIPLIEALRNIGSWTPSADEPFPPSVPGRLRSFCEMLYWRDDAWRVESKRQIWTARLFKSPFLPHLVKGGLQTAVCYLFEGVLVSLIVQIWMVPLLVVYFHRISAASILLNLWVGFFIALESFAAVIGALAVNLSGLASSPFFAAAEAFNWLMLAVPWLFSDNGWASWRLPAYSGPGRAIYFLYMLPVVFLAYAVNRWRPFELKPTRRYGSRIALYTAAAALPVLLSIVIFHPFSAPRADGRLHIDFLDVGQGDSALITFPEGKTMLVDGGGRFRYRVSGEDAETFEPDVRGIGEAVVSEFLWNRGYSQIDYILATHADADHIQGLTDVARNFKIGSAEFGRKPMPDPDFAALDAVMRYRGIPADTISRGDRLRFGDVTVEVIYPIATSDPDAVSDNDHSVVLRIVFGNRAFLMTGDIERRAESDILAAGGTVLCDLIKVAHHGSRTSSTPGFVEAAGAQYAVISVGRASPFGHPHPDVVERWRANGVSVMTTGERGTISVATDGKDLDIKTFLP